jgi:hypothetical protein
MLAMRGEPVLIKNPYGGKIFRTLESIKEKGAIEKVIDIQGPQEKQANQPKPAQEE